MMQSVIYKVTRSPYSVKDAGNGKGLCLMRPQCCAAIAYRDLATSMRKITDVARRMCAEEQQLSNRETTKGGT
jgi:hypothetical protein